MYVILEEKGRQKVYFKYKIQNDVDWMVVASLIEEIM